MPTATDAQPAPRILLVTWNWSTLTEMPYLLKQAGCAVDVLCPAGNWAIGNSFFDRWIDAGDSLESLLQALIALVDGAGYRHIMIGDDPILWAIYRNRIAALWPLLPVKNTAALPILNKLGLAEHCRRHGIAAPDFCRVEGRADALQALRVLGLPLVLKENYSNGGAGVRVFRDEAAYQAFVEAHEFREPLLAQRFIQGRHVDVEALFKEGRLLHHVCAEVLEDDGGPSSKRRYFASEADIGALIAALGQTAGLHGFANMALMQARDSQAYYLFEADPRPNKWVPYARWFRGDFAPALRLFLAEGDGEIRAGGAGGPDDPAGLPATVHQQAGEEVACWDAEHFTSHCTKLLMAGRYVDVILHLLSFDENLRYTLYDPRLLKAKADDLRQQVLAQRDALTATLARRFAAQAPLSATVTVNHSLEHAMPTITIDNQAYDLESLSPEAKAQLASIQFVDQELARLQAQTAALQTARNAYAQALRAALPVHGA